MSRWRGALGSATAAQACGKALGQILRPGDLVVLNGPLGAGKTTLTQGIAQGLQVRGPITSPTFVIARIHPSLVKGPMLVHVDAYRLAGHAELDDLDLDTDVDQAVTVVEWGAGLAESLGESRLEITLGMGGRAVRTIEICAMGPRWSQSRDVIALAAMVDLEEGC